MVMDQHKNGGSAATAGPYFQYLAQTAQLIRAIIVNDWDVKTLETEAETVSLENDSMRALLAICYRSNRKKEKLGLVSSMLLGLFLVSVLFSFFAKKAKPDDEFWI